MPKILDITNKKFGCVVALSPTNNKASNRSIIWECQCEKCQSKLYLSTKQLKAQKFLNCPECKKKSELGKVYGNLTVEEYYPTSKTGTYWKCKCSCGKFTIVSTSSLHSGHTQSCGCLQKKKASEACIDMTGQIIGKWKVLSKSSTSTNSRQVKWLCECSCSQHTLREISGVELRRGTTLSCGCLRASHGEYKIAQILLNNNIPFVCEKKFSSCIFEDTHLPARFDFFVNNKYLIEFDGIQHYEPIWGRDNLLQTQKRDAYKNQWCKKNNIPLIRIPYYHLQQISFEDLQIETSKFLYKLNFEK